MRSLGTSTINNLSYQYGDNQPTHRNNNQSNQNNYNQRDNNQSSQYNYN